MTLCTTNFSTETKGNKLEIPIEFGLWREEGGAYGVYYCGFGCVLFRIVTYTIYSVIYVWWCCMGFRIIIIIVIISSLYSITRCVHTCHSSVSYALLKYTK